MSVTRTEKLRAIRENLNTQDNRATAIPIFCVMQKQRVYGVGADYGGIQERVFDDFTRKYRKVRYVEVDEFVTACFTEQGCKDYIKINGHNLKAPFIFAFGGWRNAEWEFVRDSLMDGTLQIEEGQPHG